MHFSGPKLAMALLFLAFFLSTVPVPVASRLAGGPTPIQYPHNTDLLFNGTTVHGFVTSHDGHLYFEDDTRARFWGVNLVDKMCFLTADQVDSLIDVLKASGANMVRLHLMDAHLSQSLIDYSSGNTSKLNDDMLARLDYLLYKCRVAGIYVYLDLLDGREFLESDGVVNASKLGSEAKVISIFDDHLIELQKQYATNLLTHVNPYTGLALVDDPTIAVVEITNENGMFWDLLGDVKGWAGIPEPYYSELKSKWNDWLVREYGTRQNLDNAWVDHYGTHGLLADEDPTAGTVRLPDVVEAWKHTAGGRSYDDTAIGHARANDGSRFAYDLLCNYYTTMKQHLRSLGVKVPIGASDNQWQVHPPTQLAIKKCLDFSAAGYYHDHPTFPGSPLMTIRNTPELFEDAESILPILSAQKIAGVPMIVREWNDVFPNDYRSESMIQMATFAAQQDWDGVLIHHFADDFFSLAEGEQKTLWWSTLHDPARWPQFSVAARIFLDQMVSPLSMVIDIGYSYTDTFYAAHFDDPWFYRAAPYFGRVRNYYFDSTYNGTADVVIGSMRTNGATYPGTGGTKTAIIAPYYWYCDLYNQELNQTATAKRLYSGLTFTDGSSSGSGHFAGFAYDNKDITWSHYYGISVSTLPSGALAFGNSSNNLWCAGFVDSSSVIMSMWDCQTTSKVVFHDWDYAPQAGGDHNVFEVLRHDSLAARILMDALSHWGLTSMSHSYWDVRTWVDDSGVWVRNETSGVFTLSTDHVAAVVGFANGTTAVGGITFESNDHHFAASVISVDGQPLATSDHMVFTAVGDAWNTNQELVLSYDSGAGTAYSYMNSWDSVGDPPVNYEDIFVRAYFGRQISASVILRGIYGAPKSVFTTTSNSLYLSTDSASASDVVALDIFVSPSPPEVLACESAPDSALAGEAQPVSVTVNLTGPDIQNVTLWYSEDEGDYQALALTYSGDGKFEGELPGGEYDTTTAYYFVAYDVFSHATVVGDNGANFTVTWIDTVPPELVDVSYSPSSPVFGSDVVLTCTVSDEHSGVSEVRATYQAGGSTKTVLMTEVQENVYSVTITNSDNVTDLQVTIEVEDLAANTVSETVVIHYSQPSTSTTTTTSSTTTTTTSSSTTTTSAPTSTSPLSDLDTLLVGGVGIVVVLAIVLMLMRRRH
ncbi:MAG: hypothetical protein DRO73_07165 [Candidatus Thorarchaeota archaeon]|nr:MAG: hypothetical protein DRO73_07165 [Candidatus Thorarchaeota archaeon]